MTTPKFKKFKIEAYKPGKSKFKKLLLNYLIKIMVNPRLAIGLDIDTLN